MRKAAQRLLKDQSGATAIEYALIAGLIGVVIIAGAGSLGTSVNTRFTSTATRVGTATPGNPNR
jgi:pilus assembly protein Flp/PilA